MVADPYRIIALQNTPADCQLIEQIFNRDEFEIRTFADARSFIQYMRIQPPPHCFLCDLEMGKENGLDIIDKVRKNQRWTKVAIVVLAEAVNKKTLVSLSQFQIKGYIVKPYQPPRLFNEVLKAMGLEVVTQKVPVKRLKSKG
ncbi:MAG: response regulator [Gammaproteobacteria bacterium]|nr:response regulator [Gammaproteobacteria bacterium]